MSPFRKRLWEADGDVRWKFWSFYLIRKRLDKGLNSAGRKLISTKVGRSLF